MLMPIMAEGLACPNSIVHLSSFFYLVFIGPLPPAVGKKTVKLAFLSNGDSSPRAMQAMR
jgi:hypothetical protein